MRFNFERPNGSVRVRKFIHKAKTPDELERAIYRERVRRFFGHKTENSYPSCKIKLYKFLERQIKIEINRNGIELPKGQTIYIANHPRLNPEFHIPAEMLPVGEGKYPQFHFPGIFQMAWHELISSQNLSQNRAKEFLTVIRDIGYYDYLNRLDCFVLPPENGTSAIIDLLNANKSKSIVIYPEGGFTSLTQDFSTGFYHAAKGAGITQIVVCHMTPEPKLGDTLKLSVLDVVTVPDFKTEKEQIKNWVGGLKNQISDYQNKNNE